MVSGPKTYPRFASALKEARLARHWKQSTLAKRLGVPVRTLISWETGTRLPTLGTIALLCRVLTDTVQVDSKLLLAAMQDDLYFQAQQQPGKLQSPEQREQAEQYRAQIGQTIEFLHHLPTESQYQAGEMPTTPIPASPLLDTGFAASPDMLGQLFTILRTFEQVPGFIPVVRDFLQQLGGFQDVADPSSLQEASKV